MSQQVGDRITCPVAQLELRAALPTSVFGGITDVFLLVCRHIKPQCALLKILQQRPGTATTQSPTWLTRSVFLYQICNKEAPVVQESSQLWKGEFKKAYRATLRVVFISHSWVLNHNTKACCSKTNATIQNKKVISSLNTSAWMTGAFCCRAKILRRHVFSKTKESIKCPFTSFVPHIG